MRFFLSILAAAGVPVLAAANEGMWTLDNAPVAQIRKDTGFAPSQAWLDRAMHGAARIAGGCSSSFISPDGLVLTNHHCVAECVEQLSGSTKDYMKDGFVAQHRADEAACPAMEVNRLEKITDVTAQVKAATAGKTGPDFKKAQVAVNAKLTTECIGAEGSKVRCDVVDLYHGGQYKLYRYHRFQDVRLVFAPEQSTAFFGGDPDNFNFPRYDLDMSMVRVYEDGKPAAIADYFPLSPKGPAAGDPVFVVGHPGSTDRGLTVAQLAMLRDVRLPDALFRLAELRGVLTQFRTEGAEPDRIANAELFYIENSYKALHGEFQALTDPKLIARKQAEETALRKFVDSHPALAKTTAHAWDEIAQAQATFLNFRAPFRQLEQGMAFDSDYFAIARALVRGAVERSKPNAERLPEFSDAALPQAQARLFSPAPIYPQFEKVKLTFSLTKFRENLGTDDARVRAVLGKESPAQVAARLVDGTKLADQALRHQLWDGGIEAVRQSTDPFIQLALAVDPQARELRKRYESEVESRIQRNSELIAQARFAKDGANTYPDATFTLRLSYGTVRGWKEGETEVAPFTQMGGAFERATGAPPYELAPTWIAAREHLDLAKPFNLVSDNDIIGGNSGSPMLNKEGELVGLVFDGNIHSLGGAFWFDPTLNRTVAVDSAAILEALDKIYKAPEILHELTTH